VTEAQYALFLSIGAWICALGSLFNLFKLKNRGTSALLMSSAFLVMGGALWLIKIHANQSLVTAAVAAVVLILIADFVLRARQQEKSR
jgi:hypothetical protein